MCLEYHAGGGMGEPDACQYGRGLFSDLVVTITDGEYFYAHAL